MKTRIKPTRIAITLLLISGSVSAVAHSNDWQVGGTIDLSYANAFQSDDQLSFRSKATTMRLNEFNPNMGMFYLQKLASDNSRWGMEMGGHAGYDTDGQIPANDRLPGYSILRYLSRANVSYLAPVGNGLTLTAGLMNSFFGFETLYAKDNFNYSRSWLSDYLPYFLIGMGGQYAINPNLSTSLYLVSSYDYLAYRSDQPKYAGQVAWNFGSGWKLTQNVFAGPEQQQTDIANWRYFSNSIVQWSGQKLTVALTYDVGTERVVQDANKQALWMGSALFSRWHIDGPWSVALRPEIYWDGDGRLTGNQQLIKAVTATLEYKIRWDSASLALRSEYRYDDSSGSQGGFFKYGNHDQLIAGQHIVFLSCLFGFERSF